MGGLLGGGGEGAKGMLLHLPPPKDLDLTVLEGKTHL